MKFSFKIKNVNDISALGFSGINIKYQLHGQTQIKSGPEF